MATAAVVFAIAALGGAVMAAMRLSGRDLPPLALAAVHGIFAAAGLIILILAVTGTGVPSSATIALVGFFIAAAGGFFLLFGYHFRHRALPVPIMFVHATVAVISFIILLVALFS